MKEIPDLIGISLTQGQSRLGEIGLSIGNLQITQAPGCDHTNNLRIIKQQLALDGRVDLVAVYDLTSVPRKEV